MRFTTLSFALLVLAGCEAGTTIDPRDGGGDTGTRSDVTRTDATTPIDAPVAGDGSTAPQDVVLLGDTVVMGAARPEICGNNFDDDGNGMIDDGCDCAVGTMRACWLGLPETRGVGACHDGIQTCQSDGATSAWSFCQTMVMPTREVLANGVDDDCDGTTDEPDGICLASAQLETGTACANGRDDDCDTRADCDDPGCAGEVRCPPGCATSETLCWGDRDDDCDGHIDCADTDCATDPSCQTGPCPPGQVPTYRERDLGTSWGASSISAGDGQPSMTMTCESGSCGAGQVAVALVGQMPICVPPPPSCPSGQYATYVASNTWRCDPPCELVVHFGSLFGGRRVCAGRPMLSCTSGQVATFIESTERWECRPECNNTTYDRITLGGATVCIPC